MFRSFIYLDEDKMYSYKSQIDGTNNVQLKTMSKKKNANASAALKSTGLSGSVETSYTGEIKTDVTFDYDRFENSLEKLDGEDYFDCVLNTDYELSTIPPMNLFRVCTPFSVPEEFDAVNLIELLKPMLIDQIPTNSDIEKEALTGVLGSASADIPIVFEWYDGEQTITVSSKLNAKYLLEDYSTLEDYDEQEVYILGKVVGLMRKDSVEIFDPFKDFIRLPRATRRHMNTDTASSEGFGKILVDGPVLKVEIIAIYK